MLWALTKNRSISNFLSTTTPFIPSWIMMKEIGVSSHNGKYSGHLKLSCWPHSHWRHTQKVNKEVTVIFFLSIYTWQSLLLSVSQSFFYLYTHDSHFCYLEITVTFLSFITFKKNATQLYRNGIKYDVITHSQNQTPQF